MESVVKGAAAPLPMVGYGDLAAAVFIIACLLIGLKRGLSGELARLASTAAALAAAWVFHARAAVWLETYSRLGAEAARVTAFTAIFVAAAAAGILLRVLLGGVAKVVFAPRLERIGGAVAGLVKGVAWTVALLVILNLVPHPYLNRLFGEECAVGRLVRGAMPALRAALEPGATPADEPIEPPAEVF
jgi:hypothetical protein